MTHLDDPTTREKIYLAMSSRASGGAYDNRAIVMDIIRLRREKASLLGYDTFADLVLEERMAKSASKARAFIDDLGERTRPHFDRERDQLLAFRRELEGPDAPPLQPWDTAYWAERQQEALYSYDAEVLRDYFQLPKVLGGLFDLVTKLYGVEIAESTDASVPVWDESVQFFEVRRDGNVIAAFYVDPPTAARARSGVGHG